MSLKTRDIRGMSEQDIKEKVKEFKGIIAKERGIIASGTRPENPGKIKSLKKSIARMKYILNEKLKGSTKKPSVPGKKETKKEEKKIEVKKEVKQEVKEKVAEQAVNRDSVRKIGGGREMKTHDTETKRVEETKDTLIITPKKGVRK